jgi:hypothetical protein
VFCEYSLRLTVESDAVAIAYAERLPTTKAIEVWEGDRPVDSIPFLSKSPTIRPHANIAALQKRVVREQAGQEVKPGFT